MCVTDTNCHLQDIVSGTSEIFISGADIDLLFFIRIPLSILFTMADEDNLNYSSDADHDEDDEIEEHSDIISEGAENEDGLSDDDDNDDDGLSDGDDDAEGGDNKESEEQLDLPQLDSQQQVPAPLKLKSHVYDVAFHPTKDVIATGEISGRVSFFSYSNQEVM